MARDAAAFEVREALREPGCAVCRLSLRSVSRLMKSIAYEQVNDLDLREALRRTGGFCNAHAHQWLRGAHGTLGTALIYRDVLRAALREIDTAESRIGQRGGRLRELLGATPKEVRCPACEAQADAEARYLSALLSLAATEVRLLEDSDGLCRRHTLAAMRAGVEGGGPVVRRAREALDGLLAELDEVIRKEDYRFRDEPRTEGERTAPRRAITWAAGLEGLADS